MKMRVVIIGGSGHMGTYLVPRLVDAGHEVIHISRAQLMEFRSANECGSRVRRADGIFGQCVRDLERDVVIDMICFTLENA